MIAQEEDVGEQAGGIRKDGLGASSVTNETTVAGTMGDAGPIAGVRSGPMRRQISAQYLDAAGEPV